MEEKIILEWLSHNKDIEMFDLIEKAILEVPCNVLFPNMPYDESSKKYVEFKNDVSNYVADQVAKIYNGYKERKKEK